MKLDLSIIKDMCKLKNVTVKDFCDAVGITEAGFYRAVKVQKVSSDFIEKASTYFDCSVDVFFKGAKIDALVVSSVEMITMIVNVFNSVHKHSDITETQYNNLNDKRIELLALYPPYPFPDVLGSFIMATDNVEMKKIALALQMSTTYKDFITFYSDSNQFAKVLLENLKDFPLFDNRQVK